MAIERLAKHRWSLSAHLTWVVLLALLPALGIQYASNLARRREAKIRAQEHLLQLVGQLASQQEQVTSSARQMLTTLSFLPELRAGDRPALSRILVALQKEDPRFMNLLALDPAGRPMAAAVPAPNLVLKDRKYFWEAVETRRFTVGEYIRSRTTGTRALHFSLPVMNNQGELLAVLAAGYDLERYGELFSGSGLPAETSLAVLDHAGTVLFHLSHIADKFGSLVGTKLPMDQAERVMGTAREGTYWARRRDGQATLFAFHQIHTQGQSRPYLYLQVGRPESQVLGESLQADRRNMLLLAATGLCALAAAWTVGNRMIARPIRQLVRASRHIGRGELYHRPALRAASREVAQLGEELGRTSSALVEREEEQRRVQEALRNAQRLESLGVLTGGIAHDFNNLLAAVLGNLNLAQMRLEPDDPVRRPLNQAEKAVQKASELTRQMLAYSGRGQIHAQPLDLNGLVQDMGHLFRVSVAKGVALQYDLAPCLCPVVADSAQIQQVVLNLAANASEAIGAGEGTITLRTRAREFDRPGLDALCPAQGLEPGPYVLLEVEDTGCGMAPELIERIFEPFFSTKPGGHGLGLSAMHGILKAHHAGWRVRSAPGDGTTFSILLPAAPEGVPEPLPGDSGPRPAYQGRALVADDEPMVLDFAAAALEAMGFNVIRARDGVEAVARFQEAQDHIQLALLDLSMPRMNGIEAFSELRRLRPSVPVILSSGYDPNAEAQHLVELGQAQFLSKPYPMRELRRAVGKAMEGTVTGEITSP